jgi:hypothetical protein
MVNADEKIGLVQLIPNRYQDIKKGIGIMAKD